MKALESVQRRFTKRLPGMEKLAYHQRLSILELDNLELRRVRADLLFTYKLVFGLIDASLHDFFIPRFNEYRRGHCYKLYLPTCKSNIRSNSFNYRIIQNWNSLPSSTDFTSLKNFINPWPLNYCSHIVRYFYLVVRVAYRQFYVFSILYSCFLLYIHVHLV